MKILIYSPLPIHSLIDGLGAEAPRMASICFLKVENNIHGFCYCIWMETSGLVQLAYVTDGKTVVERGTFCAIFHNIY